MRMITKPATREELLKDIVIAYDNFLYNEYEERVDDIEEMMNDVMNGKSEWYDLAVVSAEYNEDLMFYVKVNITENKVTYLINNTKGCDGYKLLKEKYFNDYNELLIFIKYASFDELISDDNFPGYSKYKE